MDELLMMEMKVYEVVVVDLKYEIHLLPFVHVEDLYHVKVVYCVEWIHYLMTYLKGI
jgi:hypothetical protein